MGTQFRRRNKSQSEIKLRYIGIDTVHSKLSNALLRCIGNNATQLLENP